MHVHQANALFLGQSIEEYFFRNDIFIYIIVLGLLLCFVLADDLKKIHNPHLKLFSKRQLCSPFIMCPINLRFKSIISYARYISHTCETKHCWMWRRNRYFVITDCGLAEQWGVAPNTLLTRSVNLSSHDVVMVHLNQ